MGTDEKNYHMLVTLFSGYKFLKERGKLYSENASTPRVLIDYYYSNNMDRSNIEDITSSFINKYTKNESLIEHVSNKEEFVGMRVMYDEMTKIPEEEFGLFSLFQLHKALFSKTPHPEYAGKLRDCNVVLLDKSHKEFSPEMEITDYHSIRDELFALDERFDKVKNYGIAMRENNDYSGLLDYIKEVVKINCELIRIQPFLDGNKRSVRCLTNKLFIIAGIPPVYISARENIEYRKAINIALSSDDMMGVDRYNDIVNFYYYKICDSIIELDINKKTKELDNELLEEHKRRKVIKKIM